MGGDGKPRELHINDALQVTNFDQVRLSLPKPKIIEEAEYWTREGLCKNPYFTVERIKIKAGASLPGQCDGETLEIWGVIKGRANVAGKPMNAVKFVFLPAGLGAFSVEVPVDSVLLRTYLS